MKASLLGMSHPDLVALCQQAGVKPVHADHIVASVFRRAESNFSDIADIPKALQSYLVEHAEILEPVCTAEQLAMDGTRKLVLQMQDGKAVETVLIAAENRLTQCISTQVGCAVGCTFCLTATAGLTRNLSAAEMVAEVMAGQRISNQGVSRNQDIGSNQCIGSKRISNIVLMGMGEPLHNYQAVAQFLTIVTDPKGMAFSPNRVTLSTSGVVPAIYRMLDDQLPCNLAVSLNATTDAVRDKIIPINRKYPIAMLMQAVRDYIQARGNKRVLIEYVMLAGVNDTIDDAKRLCTLLEGLRCTINLLPFNSYQGSAFKRPEDHVVRAFQTVLVEAKLIAIVRQSKGRDISAACGQLITELRSVSKKKVKGNAA